MQPQLICAENGKIITTESGIPIATGTIVMNDGKSVYEFLDKSYQWVESYLNKISRPLFPNQ